jgi:alkaline phosphatase
MTARALDLLAGEQGYFLMVEGGRIDHAHHAGNAARALHETLAFADAVDVALLRTDPTDTLLLVTADHSHVLTLGGWPARGNSILDHVRGPSRDGQPGALELDLLGRPHTTLGYANGPGATEAARREASTGDPRAKDHRQQATVPLASETHGGEDVAAFARGPWAHLLRRALEQHVLFHVMATALDPPPTGAPSGDTPAGAPGDR